MGRWNVDIHEGFGGGFVVDIWENDGGGILVLLVLLALFLASDIGSLVIGMAVIWLIAAKLFYDRGSGALFHSIYYAACIGVNALSRPIYALLTGEVIFLADAGTIFVDAGPIGILGYGFWAYFIARSFSKKISCEDEGAQESMRKCARAKRIALISMGVGLLVYCLLGGITILRDPIALNALRG